MTVNVVSHIRPPVLHADQLIGLICGTVNWDVMLRCVKDFLVEIPDYGTDKV